jgi:hypothetical protein
MTRTVPGQPVEDDQHDGQRDHRETEGRMPAEPLGDARGEQRREQRTGVPGAGNAHRQALILGWIPAARQRQRHGETGAGDAEEEAERVEVRHRLRKAPGQEKRHQGEDEAGQARRPSADPVAEHPHDRPEQRSAEQGDCGEQPLLGGAEAEVLAQERRQRPEHDPDHEADIEVEQRRDEGRRVSGRQEARTQPHAASELCFCSAVGRPMLTTPSFTRVG